MKQRLTLISIVLLSLGITLFLFATILRAGWSPVDDHELMNFLRGDARLTVARAQELFTRDLSGTGRYHPTYDYLRVSEALLWGSTLSYWFLFRLLIFSFACGVVLWALVPTTGIVLGTSMVFWFFSKDFWADIVARLGPSESYALLGFSWILLSVLQILRDRSLYYSRWWWGVLTLATIATLATKENMLIAIVPICLVFFDQWYGAGKRHLLMIVAVGVCLLASVGMVLGVRAAVRSGQDVYGNSTSLASRMVALRVATQVRSVRGLLLFALLALVGLWVRREPEVRRRLYWIIAVCVMAVILYVSQFVFYLGAWPAGMRYDFPGVAYRLLVASMGVMLLLQAQQRWVPSRWVRYCLLGIGTGLFLLLTLRHQGIPRIWERTTRYVAMTRAFTTSMEQILQTDPRTPIVLESTSVNDLELVHAIQVYIRVLSPRPTLLLRLHHGPYADPFEARLYESLSRTSTQGTDLIQPWQELRPGDCFSLSLSTPVVTTCTPIGTVTGQW